MSERPFLSVGGDVVGDVLVGESVDLGRLIRLVVSLLMFCMKPLIVDMAEFAIRDAEFLDGLGWSFGGDDVSGGVVVESVAGESDAVVVGGNRCVGSVDGVDVFFGVFGHSLVSCVVLQHLKHPNLGIGVTWLYSLSVIAHMLSSLSVCSYEIASSRACVPSRFKWFFSS